MLESPQAHTSSTVMGPRVRVQQIDATDKQLNPCAYPSISVTVTRVSGWQTVSNCIPQKLQILHPSVVAPASRRILECLYPYIAIYVYIIYTHI